jgi:RNA polymerase sigma factor (TIGR02999 family)
MPAEPEQPVTELLRAAQAGDAGAAERLLAVVYEQLRQVARARMAHLAPGQTLQPTALVHEAYLRLTGKSDVSWESRQHFFFAAARAMRDILVEQARRSSSW